MLFIRPVSTGFLHHSAATALLIRKLCSNDAITILKNIHMPKMLMNANTVQTISKRCTKQLYNTISAATFFAYTW